MIPMIVEKAVQIPPDMITLKTFQPRYMATSFSRQDLIFVDPIEKCLSPDIRF